MKMLKQYELALEGLPADARGDLANLHNNLAHSFRFGPDRRMERSFSRSRNCVYWRDAGGNVGSVRSATGDGQRGRTLVV